VDQPSSKCSNGTVFENASCCPELPMSIEAIARAARMLALLHGFEEPLPYLVSTPLLPALTAALKTLNTVDHADLLKNVMSAVGSAYCAIADDSSGVDWPGVVSSGLLRRLFELSVHSGFVIPVLQVLGAAALTSDPHVVPAVFDSDAYAWLAWLARQSSMHENDNQVLFMYYWLLSNLAADEANGAFFDFDLLQDQLFALSRRLRVSGPTDRVWAVACAATWVLTAVLTHLEDERLAPLLARAGALELTAAVLTLPASYEGAESVNLIRQAAYAAEEIIDRGGSEEDRDYIRRDAPLANAYLAAFCAAGGCGAIPLAQRNWSSGATQHVVELFAKIGVIVGAAEDVVTEHHVAPALLKLALDYPGPGEADQE